MLLIFNLGVLFRSPYHQFPGKLQKYFKMIMLMITKLEYIKSLLYYSNIAFLIYKQWLYQFLLVSLTVSSYVFQHHFISCIKIHDMSWDGTCLTIKNTPLSFLSCFCRLNFILSGMNLTIATFWVLSDLPFSIPLFSTFDVTLSVSWKKKKKQAGFAGLCVCVY